jgi:type IV secretory pathway TrbF-like protein
MPGSNWNGNPGDQAKYSSFYNTITAVETYNAYILSQLVTDNLAALSTSQKALTDMANGSNFFSQVASETVGVVLRQILMFESQSFIVLTQMLEVQKQLLASQAMTNTMLMNTGTTTEQILLRKAIVKTAS